MAGLCCTLCGVALAAHASPPERLWMRQIRAVWQPRSNSEPFLSGLGTAAGSHRVYRVSSDPSISYLDQPAAAVRREVRNSDHFVHDTCWRFLLARAAGGRAVDPDAHALRVARAFSHILRCTPQDSNGRLFVRHDYGGAATFRRTFNCFAGDEQSPEVLPDEWRFLVADPTFDLDRETKACHLASRRHRGPEGVEFEPTPRGDDAFVRLPPELISLIVLELPSTDVCNLRLASSAVCGVTTGDRLPQYFWRSRFASHGEMDFFFAGKPAPVLPHDLDWRALYFQARGAVTDPSLHGFHNRKRIWKCVGYFWESMAPLMDDLNRDWPQLSPTAQLPPSIRPDSPAWRSPVQRVLKPDLLELPRGLQPGPLVRTEALQGHAREHLVLPPLPWPYPICLAVSFIVFNLQTYVSGLRLRPQADGNPERTLARVGILVPNSEKCIDLDPNNLPDAIRVYCIRDGVVGLGIIGDDQGPERSAMVRSLATQGDVAVTELWPWGEAALRGLVLSFDVCKCTAVQLLSGPDPTQEISDDKLVTRGLETRPSILWKPDILPSRGRSAVVYANRNLPETDVETSRVRVHMDFGGPRGEKLALLNKIVARIGGERGLIFGFEFSYDDGTKVSYGSKRNHLTVDSSEHYIEMSFVVCGSQGERVTEIRAFKTAQGHRDQLWGLEVSTNKGARCFFELHQERWESDKPVPFKTLKASQGHSLTGLVAELASFEGHLVGVGVTEAPVTEQPAEGLASSRLVPHTLKLTAKDLHISRVLLTITGGCVTSTSLVRVRRIEFSAGTDDYSRSSGSLSGLRLQFYDSDRPAIIGQWVQCVDSMDIDDGDEVTHIRLWYSETGEVANSNTGQLLGIMITTAKGATKTVMRGESNASWQGIDYYSDALEQIAGLVWCFHGKYDHLQVVRVPRHGDAKLRSWDPDEEPPSRRFTSRDFHDARRFLWAERTVSGKAVSLREIRFFFNEEGEEPYRGVRMTGLKFIYEGDMMRSMGSCEGEGVSMSLAPGETVLAMDTSIRRNRASDALIVALHTDRQMKIFQHSRTKHRVPKVRFARYIMQPNVTEASLSSPGDEDKVAVRVCEPPPGAGPVMGLCVFPQLWSQIRPHIESLNPLVLDR